MGGTQILELIEQARKSGLGEFLTQNPVAKGKDAKKALVKAEGTGKGKGTGKHKGK